MKWVGCYNVCDCIIQLQNLMKKKKIIFKLITVFIEHLCWMLLSSVNWGNCSTSLWTEAANRDVL